MLEELRKQIDKIDAELVKLISERASVASQIAHTKSLDGSPIYRPDREQKVYQKVSSLNQGILDNESMCNIYREIMSATLKLEGAQQVAFFGALGSFTHQAAINKFGHSLEFSSMRTIEDVFDAVQRKHYRYGVVPIENSTEGMVNATLDCLLRFDLNIYAEIRLPIQHQLFSYASDLSEIKVVRTHHQAYAQCRRWIQKNLTQAEFISESSTSEAIRKIADEKNSSEAAIGSTAAGELFNAPLLVRDIADYDRNFTRFFIISHDKSGASDNNHTLISFILPNKAGALYDVLEPFAKANVNLTSIQSRPMKTTLWSYVFFADLDGHYEQENIQDLIKVLKEKTDSLRVLGSYPIDITSQV